METVTGCKECSGEILTQNPNDGPGHDEEQELTQWQGQMNRRWRKQEWRPLCVQIIRTEIADGAEGHSRHHPPHTEDFVWPKDT